MVMFEIGQYVMKANTGVCQVVAITTYNVTDEEDERLYYNLSPYGDAKAMLFVPVDSSCSNIRALMTSDEARSLIDRIPEIEAAWIESDRLREQEYKNAIKSNEPEQLVSMIKNLYCRSKMREQQGKKSTAVDDRYFKMAEAALYQELAVALGKELNEMREVILTSISTVTF